jgi:hypothetical protein
MYLSSLCVSYFSFNTQEEESIRASETTLLCLCFWSCLVPKSLTSVPPVALNAMEASKHLASLDKNCKIVANQHWAKLWMVLAHQQKKFQGKLRTWTMVLLNSPYWPMIITVIWIQPLIHTLCPCPERMKVQYVTRCRRLMLTSKRCPWKEVRLASKHFIQVA